MPFSICVAHGTGANPVPLIVGESPTFGFSIFANSRIRLRMAFLSSTVSLAVVDTDTSDCSVDASSATGDPSLPSAGDVSLTATCWVGGGVTSLSGCGEPTPQPPDINPKMMNDHRRELHIKWLLSLRLAFRSAYPNTKSASAAVLPDLASCLPSLTVNLLSTGRTTLKLHRSCGFLEFCDLNHDVRRLPFEIPFFNQRAN